MTRQLAIPEAGPIPDRELSQWFTPPRLARMLVGMAESALVACAARVPVHVLEPSAGRGHLVTAVLELCPGAEVDAVEIDPRWRADLERLGVHVEIGDYLARPAPDRRYDLIVANPPFDNGEEAAHLAKMLDEAERVVALLPARALHGRARYERIWRRVERGEWWLREIVHLISRPRFAASGGSDEIVLVDLVRTRTRFERTLVRWA